MEIIELNGKKYIEYEEYKKLAEKGEINLINLKDYWVTDACNVMAIIPNRELVGDTFFIKEMGLFKEFKEDVEIKLKITDLMKKFEVVKFSKTKFSAEYIEKAVKTAKEYIGQENFRVFLVYDEKENKFVEDNPCLLVFDNMVFCLAPRIESD